jgi:hypothetical protein
MSDVVKAFGDRTDNATLITDCAQLGYLNKDDMVADVTYGLGRFWTSWSPDILLASDLDPIKSPCGLSIDFTDLPFETDELDAVVFDPPYRFAGTSRMSSDAGYGIGAYMPTAERMDMIFAGVAEAARVTRPGGKVFVKCMDQVVSGKVVFQTLEIAEFAAFHRLDLIDMLHVASYRPQPTGRRQVHARRDYSTLLVFEKMKVKS